MEMLRTIVVALVFAGITVCTYYYLNSSQFPWEIANPGENMAQTSGNPAENTLPAPGLNDPEMSTFAQDGPFAPLPTSTGENDEFSLPGMDELPQAEDASEGSPMVAASTTQLPTPPISDTDLPALSDQKNPSPFESSPAAIHAQHQGQIGSNAMETTQGLPSPDDPMTDSSLGNSSSTELSLPNPLSDPPVSNTIQSQNSVTNPLRQNSAAPVSVPRQTSGVAPSSAPAVQAPAVQAPVVPAPVVPAPAVQAPAVPAPAVPAPAVPSSAPSVPAPNEIPAPVAGQPSAQPDPEAEAAAEAAAVREYLKIAKEKIQNGEALEVLRQLSMFYGNPRFTAEESSELVSILVQAASQVIYSQKSFLDPPYTVQAGDTVEKIAAEYQIPQEFIILVNGLQPGAPLQPGTNLKVIRGPFHALVYLDRHEMLLTLNGLFAGRFWIGIGGELIQKDSDFSFAGKSVMQNGTVAIPCCDFNLTAGEPECAQTMKIQACDDPNAIGNSVPTGTILMSRTDVQNLSAILGPKSRLLLRCHSLKPVAQQMVSGTNPGTVPPSSVPAQAQTPAYGSNAVPAPAPAYGSAPAPASVPAPAPAYGSSAELPNSLPNTLPDTLPGTAPAPAMAPADELPLELPATL